MVKDEAAFEAAILMGTIEDRAQPWIIVERKFARLPVLRDCPAQPNSPGAQVHVVPFQCPHLVHPPAASVQEFDPVAQVTGQSIAQA